jgi:hypothetical protein
VGEKHTHKKPPRQAAELKAYAKFALIGMARYFPLGGAKGNWHAMRQADFPFLSRFKQPGS